MEFKLKNKKHTVVFNYGVFKKVGIKWGIRGLKPLMEAISTMFQDFEDLDFEAMDKLCDLVMCGLQADANFTEDDLANAFLTEPVLLEQVATELMAAFPTPKQKQRDGLGK